MYGQQNIMPVFFVFILLMKNAFIVVGFSGFHVMAFDWYHFLGSHATLDIKSDM
jgi:hypothetical protein